MALVFEHVDLSDPGRGERHGIASPQAALPAGARSPLASQGSLAGSSVGVPGSPRSASGVLAEHGPANAALKLLDNLCMMLTGAAAAAGPALLAAVGCLSSSTP